MKFIKKLAKIGWTVVKVVTIPVGATALFLQYTMADGIGVEEALKLKADFWKEATAKLK